ncbi:MAG TPA: bifunctional RNase H/acid phosphatase [Actinomycetes bacterium]|nr:bifunctional RNase H/acid phosphatase [Actinomycetes bacterium]
MTRRLVLEADGGSRGNPGPAAYGTVVRDAATGEVLHEEGASIGVDTNNVAEYQGLIAGLRAAHKIDPDAQVEARLDSKLIVEQMSGRWKIKHENMQRLALEAKEAFPVSQVSYTWVPREQNKAADALVNAALDGTPTRRISEAGHQQPADATDVEPERPANALVGWSETHPTVTQTVLVRHGETVHTQHKRFSGWGGDDPGLSETGRTQARLTGKHLANGEKIDLVVASPMARTQETASIVAQSVGAELTLESNLRECAFGAWDGLTFAEVQERAPDQLERWLQSTSVRPPGGESFDEVAARVSGARDRLLARHPGETLLLVTHVTPLKILVRMALDAPSHSLFRMEVRPASISVVQWFGDGHASVRSFNETSHLGD